MPFVLHFTPLDRLLDAQRRPTFLWDCDVTLEQFRANLEHSERDVRAYWIAKLMRQAKPDDVFQFVTRATIQDHWDALARHLGTSREFWTWLLAAWREAERVAG